MTLLSRVVHLDTSLRSRIHWRHIQTVLSPMMPASAALAPGVGGSRAAAGLGHHRCGDNHRLCVCRSSVCRYIRVLTGCVTDVDEYIDTTSCACRVPLPNAMKTAAVRYLGRPTGAQQGVLDQPWLAECVTNKKTSQCELREIR